MKGMGIRVPPCRGPDVVGSTSNGSTKVRAPILDPFVWFLDNRNLQGLPIFQTTRPLQGVVPGSSIPMYSILRMPKTTPLYPFLEETWGEIIPHQ